MKEVKEAPKSGQFVALYVFNGDVWSGIYRYIDGVLYEYDTVGDDWDETNDYFTGSNFSGQKFFVKG